MIRRHVLGTGLLGIAIFNSVGCKATPAWRDIDPLADETLRVMSDALREAPSFSFHAVTTTDVPLADGPFIEYAGETHIRVRRPDRLAATIRGDLGNENVWYNGRQLTVMNLDRNEYAVEDVPDTLDAMLEYIVNKYGVTLPLADFAYSNPYNAVMPDVLEGRYFGRHEVDGQSCHHLLFRQARIDWQIWIDATDLPVPRRVVIIHLDQDRQPRFKAHLSEWDLAADFPDDDFEFSAGTDPQRVTMDALVGANEGDQPCPPADAGVDGSLPQL